LRVSEVPKGQAAKQSAKQVLLGKTEGCRFLLPL
jgi:hypothetical protein